MKIPKPVAKWMGIGSYVTTLGVSFSGNIYFTPKKEELLNNSPTVMGLRDVEEALPRYEKEISKCAPRSVDASPLENCVEMAKGYDVLQNQLTTLKNDPEYISTMKEADRLGWYAEKTSYYGLVLLIPAVIGFTAYSRRRREEVIESSKKQDEYFRNMKNQSKGEQ